MVELKDPQPPHPVGGLECRREAGSGLLFKVFPVKLEQKLEEKRDEQKSNVGNQLCVCVQADACLCVHVCGTEGSGAAVCSTGWQGAVRMALFPVSALK